MMTAVIIFFLFFIILFSYCCYGLIIEIIYNNYILIMSNLYVVQFKLVTLAM